jgi:hypothetical protein
MARSRRLCVARHGDRPQRRVAERRTYAASIYPPAPGRAGESGSHMRMCINAATLTRGHGVAHRAGSSPTTLQPASAALPAIGHGSDAPSH